MTVPSHPQAADQTPRPEGAPPLRGAELQLWRVDPWSVLRYAAVLSLFGFVVWMVTVFFLYQGLSALGLLDSLRELADSLFKESMRDTVDSYLTLGSFLKIGAVVGLVGAIISTVLATFLSFVHNLISKITGGVNVSLRTRR